MSFDEVDTAILTAIIGLLGVLITSFFVTRLHRLESRVETLEKAARRDWARIRQLIDFIYRHGLVPPEPQEEPE